MKQSIEKDNNDQFVDWSDVAERPYYLNESHKRFVSNREHLRNLQLQEMFDDGWRKGFTIGVIMAAIVGIFGIIFNSIH